MNLTPRATQALENARLFAREAGHDRVGSQHLLYGLFQLGDGVHFHVLRNAGFTSDSLRQGVTTETLAAGSALEALEQAEIEATALTHRFTGTEHILLALLADGAAAHLFTSQGVDRGATRQIILGELRPPPPDPSVQ